MSISSHVRALLGSARASTRIAIVGASNDRRKYGHIIVQDLKQKGFTVLPVNPSETEVAGLPAFAKVADIPGDVHLVNFVVPPEIAAAVLDELDPQQTPVVWFQPGAFDRSVVDAARARFPEVIAGPCIMVET